LKLFYWDENHGLCEKKHLTVTLGLENPDIIVKNALIEFSNDCKYLAIFMKQLNKLKIIQINESGLEGQEPIEEAFRKLKENQKLYMEIGGELCFGESDLEKDIINL